VRLICWNVNKPAPARIERQAAALGGYGPDVVALQEVRAATVAAWREALGRLGLGHCALGFDAVPEALADRRRSVGGVLVASRWPIEPLAGALAVPWAERVVSAVVRTTGGEVEVHAVYVPNAATGPAIGLPMLKVETFEGIAAGLARPARRPRILCGDFNAPLNELADGTLVPFGKRGRAAEAELGIFVGLAAAGLPDVFRALHGYGVDEASWFGPVRGYRLDHAFASAELGPRACRYLHDLRAAGLSDHAALEVVFEV
jgi:exonuclease III